MRSHSELLAEIALRAQFNLPRIELTQEEKARAFGDTSWSAKDSQEQFLADRYAQGLPMSKSDKTRARKFLKQQQAN